MSKNNSAIQILRTKEGYDLYDSNAEILDGQPLYCKDENSLYVGKDSKSLDENGNTVSTTSILKDLYPINYLKGNSTYNSIEQASYKNSEDAQNNPKATGFGSVALGGRKYSNNPSEQGETNIAAGIQSFVAGCGNYTVGNWSFVIGENNYNYGNNVFMTGKGNLLRGINHEDIPLQGSTNVGSFSAILGNNNTFQVNKDTNSTSNLIFGNHNQIKASYGNQVTGNIIGGYNNNIFEKITNTFIMGDNNIISNSDSSIIAGRGLNATMLTDRNYPIFIFGMCNNTENMDDKLLIVANGSSSVDRKNAFEILKAGGFTSNGNSTVNGNLTVDGHDINLSGYKISALFEDLIFESYTDKSLPLIKINDSNRKATINCDTTINGDLIVGDGLTVDTSDDKTSITTLGKVDIIPTEGTLELTIGNSNILGSSDNSINVNGSLNTNYLCVKNMEEGSSGNKYLTVSNSGIDIYNKLCILRQDPQEIGSESFINIQSKYDTITVDGLENYNHYLSIDEEIRPTSLHVVGKQVLGGSIVGYAKFDCQSYFNNIVEFSSNQVKFKNGLHTDSISPHSSSSVNVKSTLKILNSSGTETITLSSSGVVTAQSFNALSDRRLKENLSTFECKKSILDLPLYKFDYINGSKNQIGCMAQDLQEICPEIVAQDDNGYLSIKESKIVYLLLDEVKKLKEEVEKLKSNN